MSVTLITFAMFGCLILLMLIGTPIVFALGATGVIFAAIFWGLSSLSLVGFNFVGFINNFILLAIPLFVFMANMLRYSGVAENLYDVMYKWFGALRGGLAIGTIVICAVMAAMSGLSAAGTVSTGLVALPAMLKKNYDKSIALGSVAAGGALGALIPPSVPMVVFCFLASTSVGKMFLAGILPGIMLSLFFIIYIFVRCLLKPELCPAIELENRISFKEKILCLRKVALPIILVIAVLGSLFSGMATPTEAAAVGSLGSIICALINRRLTKQALYQTALATLKLSSMLIWVMVAAGVFNSVFTGLGASQLVSDFLLSFQISPWAIIIIMQVSLLLLGCVMDPNGIMMITIPIYVPIITLLGFDPIWFGLLFIMNIEIAYLTPPFGWNIFYIKSISPEGITIMDIWKAVVPFICIQLLALILIMVFPLIALYLPNTLM